MTKEMRFARRFHQHHEPGALPWYGLTEAAGYLSIPFSTLRSWVCGRDYPAGNGLRRFAGLIALPDPEDPRLSFHNLVEAHVLRSLREVHGVRIREVRKAIEYAERELGIDRPLLSPKLQTAASNLFIEHYGQLINVGRDGQLAMKEILDRYLQRVLRNREGLPIRLFPVSRQRVADSPTVVAIDPRVAFGRPTTQHGGIETRTIATRFEVGEGVLTIASDYGIEVSEVEEAIRYESGRAA